MADTFFNLDTVLNNEDNVSSDEVDCVETEEEEYDALNDETFGALEDSANLDDWEQQHEQYAEITESSRHSGRLENSIKQLVLEDDIGSLLPPVNSSIWSFKENEISDETILSTPPSATRSSSLSNKSENKTCDLKSHSSPSFMPDFKNAVPKKICTVEELERGFLNNKQQKSQNVSIPPHVVHPLFKTFQHRLPPGLPHPLNVQQNYQSLHHPLNLPPGFVRMIGTYPHVAPPSHGMPHLAHRMLPHRPPSFPVNHPYNYHPAVRNSNMTNVNHMSRNHPHNTLNYQQHHQQRLRNDSNNFRQKQDNTLQHAEVVKDEYSGLMTNREKQWLLNIQLLQLNTGTPYFDDYYYTIFKARKLKSQTEAQQNSDRGQKYHNRMHRDHYRNNNERQDVQPNTLQPKTYTPLQFENSLGKLQCGSVMAPRKIIDMDVVTLEKDAETTTPSRESKKTKQLLLELEAMYSLTLKAEDLKNPTALSNMEKLLDIKQKQRLRELDLAPTPEEKQEILRLMQQESEPVDEDPDEFLLKVINGFLRDDKCCSFLNIRKGKMLLLRILPQLKMKTFKNQLLELWLKVMLTIPMIGRRDAAGNNLLPSFHPHFKRYIHICKLSDILEITINITEVIRQESSRSTPLSYQSKTPLHFIVGNQFGVSALVTMFVRSEYLISMNTDTVPSKESRDDWENFVTKWIEITSSPTVKVVAPIELIPTQVFQKCIDRIPNLNTDKIQNFKSQFVEPN